MYNELGGSDESYIIRNLLLAATYAGYCAGAVKVASGYDTDITRAAYDWIAMIAGVKFTTMHVQGVKDQKADDARRRKTFPLVLGDGPARWTIAVPVLVWSLMCPTFWSLQLYESMVSIALGPIVVYRVILIRGISADRLTWKIWGMWLPSLYFLPVFKTLLSYRTTSYQCDNKEKPI